MYVINNQLITIIVYDIIIVNSVKNTIFLARTASKYIPTTC